MVMEDPLVKYEEAHAAFADGSILEADDAKLRRYLEGMANQRVLNPGNLSRDIIRGLTLNNLILRRHIDSLDRQNRLTQRLLMGLTIAALAMGGVQTYLSYKALPPSVQGSPAAPAPTATKARLPAPTPPRHQASDPAKR